MTDKQISEVVEKAMMLGRKEAYLKMFHIVSDMYLEDDNDSLKKLLNILHEKVIYGDQEE